MRFIVYGIGAIGGTIASALSLSGQQVVGIARGKMLEAIQRDGLKFRTTEGDNLVRLECVGTPAEISFRPDDVIFLTMKSQDTGAALIELRNAGVRNQAVICSQNGVANERAALRLFPNVYAMTVMCPADYTTPGEVVCYGTPNYAMMDVGRYPTGTDNSLDAIVATLQAARFAVFPMADVMGSKYAKLLENLGNVIDAALAGNLAARRFHDLAKQEALAAYAAAGITNLFDVGMASDRRKGVMEMGRVEGARRAGSSSRQSLLRGAGSIETDFLNGEIVLLGRLHGVPTPLNVKLCELGRDLTASGVQPGSFTPEDLARRLGLDQVAAQSPQ